MIKTKEALLFERASDFLKFFDEVTPLNDSLKGYFKTHKNMGVNDRRRFSRIIYSFFRTGRFLNISDPEEVLMLSVFLQGTDENYLIKGVRSQFEFIKPEDFLKTIAEKFNLLRKHHISLDENMVFPYPDILSKGVTASDYGWSLLEQPLVFVRIRKNEMEQVLQELQENKIEFTGCKDDQNCLSFEPAVKLTFLNSFVNGKFVIQDRNSQQTLNLLPELAPSEFWWDCCCGAGGKSLLFKEKFPNNLILLSDSRKSVLENASQRMKAAGFDRPEILNLDLIADNAPGKLKTKFDGIIADVPCTGSGTWARSPEQLHFFRPNAIHDFTDKQHRIIDSVDPCLKQGGLLLYITCSVFSDENEGMTEYIQNKGYELIQSKLLRGWESKCDSFYTALLRKNSSVLPV
ncbi:MAG: hypothetical protein LC117_02955 [Bacteroidia bacterium]|nr:hypothetical protein [Bacteroidia bacterium]MCZ2276872.1 hypothetical protein [Bacteroidia bacterium]